MKPAALILPRVASSVVMLVGMGAMTFVLCMASACGEEQPTSRNRLEPVRIEMGERISASMPPFIDDHWYSFVPDRDGYYPIGFSTEGGTLAFCLWNNTPTSCLCEVGRSNDRCCYDVEDGESCSFWAFHDYGNILGESEIGYVPVMAGREYFLRLFGDEGNEYEFEIGARRNRPPPPP